MTKHFISFVLFTTFAASCGHAMADEAFVKEYLSREGKLFDKYCVNRKESMVSKSYTFDGERSILFLSGSVDQVSGGLETRSRYRSEYAGTPDNTPRGSLHTRQGQFWVKDEKGIGRYTLVKQMPAILGSDRYANFLSGSAGTFATTYMDATYVDRLGSVLRDAVGSSKRPESRTITSVADGVWKGKPVKILKLKSPQGLVSTTYLDPRNDFAILGYETDGTYDFKTRKTSSVRQVGEVIYSDDKPVPLPVRYESYFVSPDGKRHPHLLIEVTEFKPYTPTADDFDLEKQFGVKPLPPGSTLQVARSGDGRSRGLWLYAAAAMFALVTAILVAYRWRSARRQPAGQASGA